MVPPSLLRVPGLASANLVTLVIYAALGAHLLFLPVYLQFLGFSPTLAGLVFAPPSIALILLAPRFGRYADRNGPRVPIAGGTATIGVAVLLLLPATDRADAWTWGVASVCLFALGLSAVVAPITAAALSPAPEDLAGVAAGLNQTVARDRRHPLGRGDRCSRRRRCSSTTAAWATRRSTRQPREPCAKRASTRSTASSSPSRRSRSSPPCWRRPCFAATVRAGRPRA